MDDKIQNIKTKIYENKKSGLITEREELMLLEKLDEKVFTEMATIPIDNYLYKDKYFIVVIPDNGRNFGKDAYFKFGEGKGYNNIKTMCRICITEPRYIKHRNPSGVKDFVLSSKEKKILIEILKSKSKSSQIDKNGNKVEITIFQEIIINFNLKFYGEKVE